MTADGMTQRIHLQKSMGHQSAYVSKKKKSSSSSDDDDDVIHIDSYRRERRAKEKKKSKANKPNSRLFNNKLDGGFHKRTYNSPSVTDSTITEEEGTAKSSGKRPSKVMRNMTDNVIINEDSLRVDCMARILHKDTTQAEKLKVNRLLILFANKFPTDEEDIKNFKTVKQMSIDCNTMGVNATQTVQCMLNMF
jgi:hypothetical protein